MEMRWVLRRRFLSPGLRPQKLYAYAPNKYNNITELCLRGVPALLSPMTWPLRGWLSFFSFFF